MAFWSSETLKRRQRKWALIKPYDVARVEHGAYELAMGEEFFVTTNEGKERIKSRGGHRKIPPGQIALLLTEESVRVPKDALALISIKARIKLRGLINISGFHVDPGFEGKLKFSVYNAGTKPITVERGEEIFLVWFASLDRATKDTYESESMAVGRISSDDVNRLPDSIASPAKLRKDLDDVEGRVDNIYTGIRWSARAIVLIVVGALGTFIATSLIDGCNPSLDTRQSSPGGSADSLEQVDPS